MLLAGQFLIIFLQDIWEDVLRLTWLKMDSPISQICMKRMSLLELYTLTNLMSHVIYHFISVVECEKSELQEKVKTLHMEEEACRNLQQRIQQLEGQISETQLHLDKESAKYHSACRQQEVNVATNTELFVVFSWRTSPSHP